MSENPFEQKLRNTIERVLTDDEIRFARERLFEPTVRLFREDAMSAARAFVAANISNRYYFESSNLGNIRIWPIVINNRDIQSAGPYDSVRHHYQTRGLALSEFGHLYYFDERDNLHDPEKAQHDTQKVQYLVQAIDKHLVDQNVLNPDLIPSEQPVLQQIRMRLVGIAEHPYDTKIQGVVIGDNYFYNHLHDI